MHRRIFSATPATEIRDIARVMLEQDIRAIPILDGTRRPIGIVTVTDLLRGLANHAGLELWT
jgi:acetoin utilization protein AcuB